MHKELGSAILRLLIVVPICACAPHCFSSRDYAGDGVMSSAGAFPRYGLKIDFDEFNLNASFNHRYSIDRLPAPESLYYVGIFPTDPAVQSKQHPVLLSEKAIGTLTIMLTDSDGNVITRAESDIAGLDWTWEDGLPFGSVYSEDKSRGSVIWPSFFLNALAHPKFIDIAYQPGSVVKNCRVRVRLIGDNKL